jgi:opacity protein-like surface antigen
MMRNGSWRSVAAIAVVSFLAISAVHAIDVEKKFRVSIQAGGYNTEDEVSSDAGNRLLILNPDNSFEGFLRDPRNEDAAIGTLGIEPAPRVMATVQYAVNRILLIEAAVGYQRGDVGDVEVQAQFFRIDIPENLNYNFAVQRIDAGEVEQVPIHLTALARFRPRADFNPFLGAGVGYTVVGYEISEDLDTLSRLMDGSQGAFQPVLDNFGNFAEPRPTQDLTGAEILAPDYFSWHAMGGAEYSFNRRWALYGEVRYTFASRDFQIRFNGSESLGVSVPNQILKTTEVLANPENYGPVAIGSGGLIDGGRLVPKDPAGIPQDQYAAFCAADPNQCTFAPGELDGIPDPGFYYVKGGSIKYGGFSAALGVRFTF